MKKNLLSILSLIAVIGIMQSCTKDCQDNSSTSISDQSISRMAQSSTDLVCMTSASKMTQSNGGFRIIMNSTAAKAKQQGSTSYPNNSMLVREALDVNGNVTGRDIMYRSQSDPNSLNGWIWMNTDQHGDVIYNASEKGAKCQSCHNGSISSTNGL